MQQHSSSNIKRSCFIRVAPVSQLFEQDHHSDTNSKMTHNVPMQDYLEEFQPEDRLALRVSSLQSESDRDAVSKTFCSATTNPFASGTSPVESGPASVASIYNEISCQLKSPLLANVGAFGGVRVRLVARECLEHNSNRQQNQWFLQILENFNISPTSILAVLWIHLNLLDSSENPTEARYNHNFCQSLWQNQRDSLLAVTTSILALRCQNHA